MKIKNLLFNNIDQQFTEIVNDLVQNSMLPKNRILAVVDNKFKDLVDQYDKQLIESYLKTYIIDYQKFLEIKNDNENKISELNEESFIHYFSYINTMHIILNKIKDNNSGDIDQNFGIILSIYAYCLRLADEIGILLLNGYNDGALREWRTLYEYTIVGSLLISEKNQSLIQRYIDYGIKIKKGKIDSYERSLKKLNFKELDEASTKKVISEFANIKSKYEKDFFNNNGWANILFNKKRIYLNDLAKKVNMDDLNPYYKWSCENVHNSINFTHDFFEKGKINISKIHAQTSEPEHLIDPMQITLKVLHMLNYHFLELISIDYEYDLNVKLFEAIYYKLQECIKKK